MRVRMFTLAAGPQGCFSPGQVVDLPDDLARSFLAGHAAELVESETPPVAETVPVEPVLETQIAPRRGETAVLHRRGGRKD